MNEQLRSQLQETKDLLERVEHEKQNSRGDNLMELQIFRETIDMLTKEKNELENRLEYLEIELSRKTEETMQKAEMPWREPEVQGGHIGRFSSSISTSPPPKRRLRST